MKILLCSKLGRTWFFIWFTGVTIYLLTKAIQRYLEFKTLQFEPVIDRVFDKGVITMYLTSIIIAISSAICCLICIIFQTGNYANDSMKFGIKILDFKLMKLKLLEKQMADEITQKNNQCSSNFWIRIKHHLPAFFSCFYFLTSLSFFLMLPYLDSEKIRHDLEPSNKVWHTNLDIVFNPSIDLDKVPYAKPVSAEFFNICISLIVHAFSYSKVFWRFNKLFSFIFIIVIFMNGLVFILDLGMVEMLIKLSRNSQLFPSTLKFEFPWIPLLSILSFLSYLFMFILQLSLFEYGYNRVKDTILNQHQGDINDNFNSYNNNSSISIKLRNVWKQLCIESWKGIMLPFVVGIISAIGSILVRLPYIYKSMRIIYPQANLVIVLANVILSIVYLVIVVVLWIFLILKSNWSIRNYNESATNSNGDCIMYSSKHNSENVSIPVYASVNRHSSTSPPVGQEPQFPIFCEKMSSQWRYSCSPPSCAPNDSNSNSDGTASVKNHDNGINKRNYIYLSRINPNMNSPTINQGIYSQLIKLTPQLNLTDNPLQSDITGQMTMSNEVSDNSSNQTVHIIGPDTNDHLRRTLERTSLRGRSELNSDLTGPEYFNIMTTSSPLLLTRQPLHDPVSPNSVNSESQNLCTQV